MGYHQVHGVGARQSQTGGSDWSRGLDTNGDFSGKPGHPTRQQEGLVPPGMQRENRGLHFQKPEGKKGGGFAKMQKKSSDQEVLQADGSPLIREGLRMFLRRR